MNRINFWSVLHITAFFFMMSCGCFSTTATAEQYRVQVIISTDDPRGGGNVYSECEMIDCTGIDPSNDKCVAEHDPGSQIILHQNPNIDSQFTGWSGAGVNCPDSGICTVTVNTPVDVTASYHFVKPARLESKPNYESDNLLSAYSDAADNDTILLRNFIFSGGLTLDQEKKVIINGGFDTTFHYSDSNTTIVGKLTVAKGSLTAIRLNVRNSK
jgi:hypothetical protein